MLYRHSLLRFLQTQGSHWASLRATGRGSKWLSRPCPRVWLCGLEVLEPQFLSEMAGREPKWAEPCPPAWGGSCSGSAAAPPVVTSILHALLLDPPSGSLAPPPRQQSGVPAGLRPRRRQRQLTLRPLRSHPFVYGVSSMGVTSIGVTRVFILLRPALRLAPLCSLDHGVNSFTSLSSEFSCPGSH